ncbi:galactokinase [Sediminibacillus halophilus]|uniref:Galactokinase n=1 Tax=Sediminibacillus halophilus TaxID=482461 RepID=A0A1G9TLY3_9BACI|nr:galactokinase [Sediminibacillus halophilus]SDM48548.1 galactokinase [Sediminibacillus halophilus]
MDIEQLVHTFQDVFQTAEQPHLFFAPGRINLIGEHTDYNGGHVFPASISFGTYAAAAKRGDQIYRFYSVNFSETGIITCEIEQLDYQEKDQWANYPKGMINYLMKEGLNISSGADILFWGDIPNGAGLSSSASIEMVTGVVAESLYNLSIDRTRMIRLGQKVENEYIGVNSGIMDQFAIGMGKKDHAILLDCQSLDYSYAPIQLEGYIVMIINTNKRRELAGSKYNERRMECERALADLQKVIGISSLGDLTEEQFEKYKLAIQHPLDRKRAKHAVYENRRTVKALQSLKSNDLKQFGELMNQSHISLQQDYEVTGKELDTIVAAAWRQPGVLGARMTGAGFGGCAIAIVPEENVESFTERVNHLYREQVGYDATFYPATISDGAKQL